MRIVALVGRGFVRWGAGWDGDGGEGLVVGQETGAVYCWSEGSASHFLLAPVFFINKPSGTAGPIGQIYLINLLMLRFLNGPNPKHIPCNWLDWY